MYLSIEGDEDKSLTLLLTWLDMTWVTSHVTLLFSFDLVWSKIKHNRLVLVIVFCWILQNADSDLSDSGCVPDIWTFLLRFPVIFVIFWFLCCFHKARHFAFLTFLTFLQQVPVLWCCLVGHEVMSARHQKETNCLLSCRCYFTPQTLSCFCDSQTQKDKNTVTVQQRNTSEVRSN